MKLIFVRHGETREGKKNIILGSLRGHLSLQGKREAKEIARELITRNIVPDVIIASPLQRAFDTAQIISCIIERPVAKDILTRERSAGDAEGKRDENIDWKTYEQKPLISRKHKGGESFLNVYTRAEKFIKKLQKKYDRETILVVSHNVFILMCLAYLKHKTIEYILRNKPKERVIVIKIK